MDNYAFDTSEHIPLEDFKKQMNVDFDDDDEYIAMLGKTAFTSIVNRTRRTVAELKVLGRGTFPEELKLATLQLAAHWYRVRENVSSASQSVVPYTLDYLIKPYTRLGA